VRFRSAFHLLLLLTASVASSLPARSAAQPKTALTGRTTESFDADWRFRQEDVKDGQAVDAPEAGWKSVTLPHDWSIAGPFSEQNPTGGAGAFLPSGIGWYRKSFTLPAESRGRRVFVEFDGVLQNSDVWINGEHLGHRPSGYVSFRYELTDHLKFGPEARNVLAVRTDTSQQPASRWYSGAGIYRHVRLVTVGAIHVEPDSLFVTATDIVAGGERNPPALHASSATVVVRAVVKNTTTAEAHVTVGCRITDEVGGVLAETTNSDLTIPAGQTTNLELPVPVRNVPLWDTAHPSLCRATVVVTQGATAQDNASTLFGVRTAEFDSQRGFLLNGRVVRLYGVCVHHEGGAFGAAVPVAVWEQRLGALRTLGVNAIRTAHNPPDPGFLDLCDRMGFLVMDELFDCWTVGKNPFDYHLYFDEWSKTDVRDTVRRDRNHPSIILYSAGNEIHDTPQEEKAKTILAGLVATFHENDPTRAVTQALFRPNVSHDYTNGLADLLDVIGTNYRDKELIAAWQDKPGRKIVGTEQRHDRETWLNLRDNPEEAGQFLWTGVDYLGEARAWPVIANNSGLIDRAGTLKPLALERRSWWGPKPTVGIVRRVAPNVVSKYDPGYEPANVTLRRTPVIFADWTPSSREAHEESVEIYSNCASVELFLNGRSLGAKPLNPDAAPRVWKVAFEPGTIRAVGSNAGEVVATDELRTAGNPAAIELIADRPTVSTDWEDVVRVTARVVDANGVLVPDATDAVTFAAEGAGAVVAVDNADNAAHDSFQAASYPAYHGRAYAFVRAVRPSGDIVLTASAPGLKSGVAQLKAAGAAR
jgi:beta-galactosidase